MPNYRIVALNKTNQVAAEVRNFRDNYPGALGYLLHNLPKRRNLDLYVDDKPVAWEFAPDVVEA